MVKLVLVLKFLLVLHLLLFLEHARWHHSLLIFLFLLNDWMQLFSVLVDSDSSTNLICRRIWLVYDSDWSTMDEWETDSWLSPTAFFSHFSLALLPCWFVNHIIDVNISQNLVNTGWRHSVCFLMNSNLFFDSTLSFFFFFIFCKFLFSDSCHPRLLLSQNYDTLDGKILDSRNPSLSIGKIIDGDGQEYIQ